MPTHDQSLKRERPFLTAEWSDLVLLNFLVAPELIAAIAPPGTEPDLHEGEALVSVVGFWFRQTRIRGVAIPRHVNFQEVNLRYYVRRTVDGELRRGVVFLREIVPRRAIALVANWLYNESYVTRPMASESHRQEVSRGSPLAPGDRLEYRWRSTGGRQSPWNRVGGVIADEPRYPGPGSLEEFIVEHYWGYSHRGRRGTYEYRVDHPPWRVAPLDPVVWSCDAAANYGATGFARFLSGPPHSAFAADGSPVQVFPGRSLEN